MAEVRVETVAGRRLWLWGQRHVINGIPEHLHQHEWTIEGPGWHSLAGFGQAGDALELS